MGHEQSSQAEIVGESSNNIVIEQGMEKIDVFHTVVLLMLLGLLITQTGYIAYRQHQRKLKRKYLNRLNTQQKV